VGTKAVDASRNFHAAQGTPPGNRIGLGVVDRKRITNAHAPADYPVNLFVQVNGLSFHKRDATVSFSTTQVLLSGTAIKVLEAGKSGRGLPHSKTFGSRGPHPYRACRLGVRQSSGFSADRRN
jgi:hypothetical protein